MRACYALRKHIAGFDFFPWLVYQAAVGVTEILFDVRSPNTRRWSEETVMRRFESILRPGPALAGLSAVLGDGVPTNEGYGQRALVDAVRRGMRFPRLKSVLPPGTERYTVTLRRDARIPHRDSLEADWREFASEIGARVIPDYEVEPIGLHERMALYAGARMNFFVTNGPVMLCFLSEYPAMGFDVNISPMTGVGVPYGEPYPWLLPDRHRQVYETATLPVIRKHFREWERSRWL